MLAGKSRDKNAKFPKGSISYLVEEKLKLFANQSKQKKIRVTHDYL